MKSSNFKIIFYFGIFVLVSGLSYFVFSSVSPVNKTTTPFQEQTLTSTATKKQTGALVFEGPKTEVCPINGALFTKDEKNIWSTRRPLLVMIENHSDSRPQSGLQNADIVYEAIAEGGITRFMGVFYCGASGTSVNKYDVGPVRSARTYFVDLASEYADYPLYNHVGGANCSGADNLSTQQKGPCTTDKRAQALEQISSYGWNSAGTNGDMNQFSLSYKACRREPERTGKVVATEHTMYCSTSELWNLAEQRGLTNITKVNNQPWDKNFTSWKFTQKDQSTETSQSSTIAFDFWTGYRDYSVSWKYDKQSNSYSRLNAGQPHVDFNTSKTITTKNIVVQFAKESRSIDEHLHNLYDMIGSGTGVLFQNGNKTEITWSKATRTSRTIFKDISGEEVNFVPGNIWVEILPIGSPIKYDSPVQS